MSQVDPIGNPVPLHDPSTQATKKCSKCGEVKPIQEFFKDRTHRDGLRSRCKKCYLPGARKWGEQNPEKMRELKMMSARRARRLHPERAKKQKARRKANPEQHQMDLAWRRRHHKVWGAANRPRIRARAKAWAKANPEKISLYHKIGNAARRARLAKTASDDTKDIKAYYKNVAEAEVIYCYWCNRRVPKGQRHVDHIIPLAKGGTNCLVNLAPACASCNFSKSAMMPDEFSGQYTIVFPGQVKIENPPV